MHAYSPDNDGDALRHFQDMISTRFDGDADVRYGNLALKAAGPHPCAQLEFGEQTRLLLPAIIFWLCSIEGRGKPSTSVIVQCLGSLGSFTLQHI